MIASAPFAYNLVIREWLNGALFPLSLSLSFIISVFLLDTWRMHGKGWTTLPGIKVSCALWWLFSAESVRAGIVWVLLRIQNDNQRVSYLLDFAVNIGFVLGAITLIGSFLRCIYLFTPSKWGHVYWVASVLLTVIFLVLSDILPPFPLLPHR